MVKKHSYMGIMHEIFSAPKQGWENVYINYHPTGLYESQDYLAQKNTDLASRRNSCNDTSCGKRKRERYLG